MEVFRDAQYSHRSIISKWFSKDAGMGITATARYTVRLNDLHKISELATERIRKGAQDVLPLLCSAYYIVCFSTACDVAVQEI